MITPPKPLPAASEIKLKQVFQLGLEHPRTVGNFWMELANNVKSFTNFSCEGGGQLLKHALDFEVSRTTSNWQWI